MQKIRKKGYFHWKILLILLLAVSCVGCKQDTANIMDEQAEVDVEVNAEVNTEVDTKVNGNINTNIEEINSEAQAAYQEFLAGERKLYIKDSHVDNPSAAEKYCIGQEGCYIQDILKYCMDMKGMWKEQYPDDPDMQDNRIKRIEYAYMDYGKDGILELAVRFVGLGTYTMHDDSSDTYVISYEDGKLVFCEIVYSYEMGMSDLYYYGYDVWVGTAAAFNTLYTHSCLDADGEPQTIVEQEKMVSTGISFLDEDVFSEIFGEFGKDRIYPENMIVTLWQYDGQKYYTYEIAADEGETENRERCEKFIALCKKKGYSFTTEEKIKTQIQKKVKELGISEEWFEEKELEWQIYENDAYRDYVKEVDEVPVEKTIINYPETPYTLTSEVRDFFYGESAEDEDKFCTFEYGEDARDFGFPQWHVPCGEFCAMQEWKYEITASSELASEDGRYAAANLNGYPNKETVWAEGVSGDGIGENINITMCCAYNDICSGEGMTSYWEDSYGNVRDGYLRFTEICIVNGYAKTRQTWEENGRVKRLCMYVEGQPYAYLELEDTIKPQYFKLPMDEIKVFDGNDIHFQFVIEDVYHGSKYDDTCMSGLILEFAGRRGH